MVKCPPRPVAGIYLPEESIKLSDPADIAALSLTINLEVVIVMSPPSPAAKVELNKPLLEPSDAAPISSTDLKAFTVSCPPEPLPRVELDIWAPSRTINFPV